MAEMYEIRKSEGETERRKLLRKLINERDGIRVLHVYTHIKGPAYWFTLSLPHAVQIYCLLKFSNSLSLDWKGDPHSPLPSSPHRTFHKLRGDTVAELTWTHFGSSRMWPFWISHESHFSLLAVRRVLSQRWSLAHTTAVATDLFSLFLPVGCGITVGSFFKLRYSVQLSFSVKLPKLMFHPSSNSSTAL